RSTSPESRSPHIHGIGAMPDGLDGNLGITRRRQQLNFTTSLFHHSANLDKKTDYSAYRDKEFDFSLERSNAR
ncbi:MAG: hypothetical protein II670_02680, partial [Alphaproteobacteria bacterium]|nr:hypothetical protein [Alphaproteobacteria bacterium]